MNKFLKIFGAGVLVVGFLGISVLVVAQVAEEPPNPFCGDGVVQSPNFYGEYEKCDDGNTSNSDGCTAGVGAESANPSGCAIETFGWAWSSNAGWLSFSCENDKSCGAVNYGVKFTSANKVEGWAWSSIMGWVCFGATCSGTPPDGGVTDAIIDTTNPNNPEIRGWAKFTSLGDLGWISFNCQDTGTCNDSDIIYKTASTSPGFITQYVVPNSDPWSNLINARNFDPLLQADILIESRRVSREVEANDFGFDIPNDAHIRGVTLDMKRHQESSGSYRKSWESDILMMLNVNGEKSGVDKSNLYSGWPTILSTTTFGGVGDNWGNILTPEIVNSPSFGFNFQIQNDDPDDGRAQISSIAMTVHYDLDKESGYKTTLISKNICSYYNSNQPMCNLHGCTYSDSCNSYNGNQIACEDNNCFYNTLDSTCAGASICQGGEPRTVFAGYAWNSLVGWLWSSPEVGSIPPWLQTRYGDIYSLGGFQVGQPQPGFNSTYRLLSSGGISPLAVSEKGSDTPWLDPNFGPIDFPTPETQFSNVLGSLDVDSLICDFGAGIECVNNLGNTVQLALTKFNLATAELGGNIYYYEDITQDRTLPLSINSPLTILNGSGFSNGSGTIVVDGDLVINADVLYSSSDVDRFRNLASLAWIIRGDLIISGNVSEIAGNFIVLGNGTACDPDRQVEVPGCGQVYTCFERTAFGCAQKRLTVNGLMMARKFYFDRTFVDPTESERLGSEVIIYDGRLLANTPPGVVDFAKSLPIWRAGTFSQ